MTTCPRGYSHIVWVGVCRWVRKTRPTFANVVTYTRSKILNCSWFQSYQTKWLENHTRYQTKWLESHTLSNGTYPYSRYMGVLPPRTTCGNTKSCIYAAFSTNMKSAIVPGFQNTKRAPLTSANWSWSSLSKLPSCVLLLDFFALFMYRSVDCTYSTRTIYVGRALVTPLLGRSSWRFQKFLKKLCQ